jgi:hypothetical protein
MSGFLNWAGELLDQADAKVSRESHKEPVVEEEGRDKEVQELKGAWAEAVQQLQETRKALHRIQERHGLELRRVAEQHRRDQEAELKVLRDEMALQQQDLALALEVKNADLVRMQEEMEHAQTLKEELSAEVEKRSQV